MFVGSAAVGGANAVDISVGTSMSFDGGVAVGAAGCADVDAPEVDTPTAGVASTAAAAGTGTTTAGCCAVAGGGGDDDAERAAAAAACERVMRRLSSLDCNPKPAGIGCWL